MKPFILPDYLDGTKEANSRSLDDLAFMTKNLSKACSLTEYNQLIIDLNKIENEEDREEVAKYYNRPERTGLYSQLMINYLLYKANPKNYIISKPLTECLKKTKIKLDRSHLPETFSAYMEIPGIKDSIGYPIEGCFCSLFQNKEGVTLMNIIFISNLGANRFVSYICMEIKLETTLEEEIERVEKLGREKGNHVKFTTDNGEVFSQKELVVLVTNIILFITSDNADLVFEKNEFDKKPSKRITQLKQFTQKNWITVGKNFHTKNLPRGPLQCDAFEVSGHYRWQACGVGMKDHKFIYIEPYMKGLDK